VRVQAARLSTETRAAALGLLQGRLRSSIFLLGYLDEHGPDLTDHPNSANFRVLLRDGAVSGVFALTRRGNLLVQADRDQDYAPAILDAIADDPIAVTGFVGDWDLIDVLRGQFVERRPGWHASFAAREPIFELPLAGRAERHEAAAARLLTAADFPAWYALREAFYQEAGMPSQGPAEAQAAAFAQSVQQRRQWGAEVDGQLVSLGALSSIARGAGLVGGVYTAPGARRRGLSRGVMERLVADARSVHGLDRLVLFTREENTSAQALYTQMGFRQDGVFGLVFGLPAPVVEG
jgi:RimJ/RimL family protein N-acetyltransferase